jgi:hypothetical protein
MMGSKLSRLPRRHVVSWNLTLNGLDYEIFLGSCPSTYTLLRFRKSSVESSLRLSRQNILATAKKLSKSNADNVRHRTTMESFVILIY